MRRTIDNIDLTKIKDFTALSAETIQAITRVSTCYHLRDREYLYHTGDTASAFFAIQRGGVRLIEHMIDGKDVSLKIYGEGDIFGLLALSGSYAHRSEVQAMADSIVVAIPGEATREVMIQHPELALVLMDHLINHIHHAHGRLQQMMAEKVQQRLARALIHYCHKFGHQTNDEGYCIDVDLSLQDIAEFVGTTQETISRTLRDWGKSGIVEHSRQHINVLDYKAIMTIADGQSAM